MIELHQFNPIAGIPNASPFCMKVETYFRLSATDYKHVMLADPRKAPKGKAPYIRDGEKVVTDSHFIITYLKNTYGDPLGEGLSEDARALHLALARLCEDHLLYPLMYFRWIQPENAAIVRDTFFAHVPALMRGLVFKVVQRQQRNLLHAQGTSRHSEAEIAALGAEDLAVLATYLGDAPYFGGDRPREVDCTTFPFIANVLYEIFDMPLRQAASDHPNLVAYRDRMLAEVFPEVTSVS